MKFLKRIADRHSIIRAFLTWICLAVFLTIVISACAKKEEEVVKEVIRPVKTMTVPDIGDLSGLSYPGTVRASQRVELAFKEIGGRLIELPIEGREGQWVKKDELLARIDPKDFQTSYIILVLFSLLSPK